MTDPSDCSNPSPRALLFAAAVVGLQAVIVAGVVLALRAIML